MFEAQFLVDRFEAAAEFRHYSLDAEAVWSPNSRP
jgi:hypothetical protein